MMGLTRKNRGMALPLVLIVLLLGGFLVVATLDVVGNLFSTSRRVVGEVELYNAASDGVEKGKLWIARTADNDNRLPRWTASNAYGELKEENLSSGDYDVLLVRDLSGNFPDIHYSIGKVQVVVEIYDMDYQVGAGIDEADYIPGMPPRMHFEADGAEMSQSKTSSYVVSNKGLGETGASEGGTALGHYLIRSIAVFEEQEKTIEEAVIFHL